MTRTALVYIMMPGDGSPLYAGKTEFEGDLDTDRENTYVHDGARHTVRIIRIVPDASDANAPPSVFVSEMKSEPLPAEDKASRVGGEDRKAGRHQDSALRALLTWLDDGIFERASSPSRSSRSSNFH